MGSDGNMLNNKVYRLSRKGVGCLLIQHSKRTASLWDEEIVSSNSNIGCEMDSHMGLQARLMSQALRKLTGIVAKSNTCVIFINQIRMKIGVMFGSPETTTGGNALKFYSSVRLDIRKIEVLKNGDDAYGTKVRVKVIKNKVAPPFKQAEYDVEYGTGINKEGGIIDLAVKFDIVNKAGTWYSYKEERIGQGRSNAINYIKGNPEMRQEIEDRIKELMIK